MALRKLVTMVRKTRTGIFACWILLFLTCPAVNGWQDIPLNQVIETWKATAIDSVQCRIVEDFAMAAGGGSPFGAANSQQRAAISRRERFRFWYVRNDGMRLDNLTAGVQMNSTSSGGTYINAARGSWNHVVRHGPGETLLQSELKTMILLWWLDPLGTQVGQELRGLTTKIGRLTLHKAGNSDSKVQVRLPSNAVLTLSERFDWRPTSVEQIEGDYTSPYRLEMQFERGPETGEVILKEWSMVGKLGGSAAKHRGETSQVEFQATHQDILLGIPGNSLVEDGKRRGEDYLIRADGRERPILPAERANGIDIPTLMSTEPGEALNQRRFFSPWVIALIAVGMTLIGAGMVLAVRRNSGQ